MDKRESAPTRAKRRSPALTARLDGCPIHDLRGRLAAAGLRPTRQRLRLGWLLFGKGNRHITAERLYEEAVAAQASISLASLAADRC